MVSTPKVGTLRNLIVHRNIRISLLMQPREKRCDGPFVQNHNAVASDGVENPQYMFKQPLPATQLEFMHEIGCEQREEVDAEF